MGPYGRQLGTSGQKLGRDLLPFGADGWALSTRTAGFETIRVERKQIATHLPFSLGAGAPGQVARGLLLPV